MNSPTTAFSTYERGRAYAVHLYTASGVGCVLLAIAATLDDQIKQAFVWLTIAVLIDATDGTLARKFQVRKVLPHIDGAKLDDIVDYLSYTLVPIVIICRSGWLPNPAWLWGVVPLIASLFAFVHGDAKDADDGFFRGFPSYWNVVAFYIAVWLHTYGPWVVLGLILALSLLSVLPVRFVYPNRPPCWPQFFVGGAVLWLLSLIAIFAVYPQPADWLLYGSLSYPLLYTVLSIYLDKRRPT